MNVKYKRSPEECIRDRDEALLSMDKVKIIRYLEKYGEEIGWSKNEDLFWLTIHKARANLFSLPIEEQEKSKQWLSEHGFSQNI